MRIGACVNEAIKISLFKIDLIPQLKFLQFKLIQLIILINIQILRQKKGQELQKIENQILLLLKQKKYNMEISSRILYFHYLTRIKIIN